MKIIMTKDFPVAEHGFDTFLWLKDLEKEVADDLGADLVLAGVAEEVKTKPAPAAKPAAAAPAA